MLTVRDLRRLHVQASFEVADSECLALQGGSGSGKTLLLRALADLDPAAGYVALDGVRRETIAAPEWRRQVCYLAAEPGWWAETVEEHFTDWQEAAPLAERLGFTTDCRHWSVTRLSTGERQRLALLRALLVRPRLLLLDEPTSALDEKGKRDVELLLAERASAGMSLLWVTHDQAQARRVASGIFMMEHGRVRAKS